MKRTIGFLSLLVIVSLSGACASEKTANDNAAPRNGVVETNANVQNLNAKTAPSNTGVVTNNNGNKTPQVLVLLTATLITTKSEIAR
jgi:hypothetical protein